MEASALLALLGQTLEADANVRMHAELQLLQLGTQPGFAPALLQIICTPGASAVACQLAAIYFKNLVHQYWTERPAGSNQARASLSTADKATLRSNLLHAIVVSPQRVRVQLLNAMAQIVEEDFPKAWPELVPGILECLQSPDRNIIIAGLQALYQILKAYEFRTSSDMTDLVKVVSATFLPLLQLAQACLALTTDDAGFAAKLACKCFLAAVSYRIPQPLLSPPALEPWIRFFLAIVNRDVADQAKKWASYTLNRLFERYATFTSTLGLDSTTDKKQKRLYKALGDAIREQVSPLIVQAYLQQLDGISHGRYCTPRVLHAYIFMLCEIVPYGNLWKQLKPLVGPLLRDAIFPLLCFSKADDDRWSSDPADFVRSGFDVEEDFVSPVLVAKSFIHRLLTDRQKQTLPLMLQFARDGLARYQAQAPGQRDPVQKDGLLHFLGTVGYSLAEEEELAPQFEQIIVGHALPEITSPYRFLRLRACWIIGQFAEVKFPSPTTEALCMQALLDALRDPEVPVVVNASMSLGFFIGRESCMLSLSQEYELDEMAVPIETLIESFPDEVQPYAVQIAHQQAEVALRLLVEIAESTEATKAAISSGSVLASELEDGTREITVMTLVRMLTCLVRAMDASPEILLALQAPIVPVLHYILRTVAVDYMNEVLEMISAFTYKIPITPAMWETLELMQYAFFNGAINYFPEMLASLDNFVSAEPANFASDPARLPKLLAMLQEAMTSEHLGEEDRACACILMESILLAFRGSVDHGCDHRPRQLVAPFVDAALQAYKDAEGLHLHVRSLEVVLNCLYTSPAVTVAHLEKSKHTHTFFKTWVRDLKTFTRVHDKKLCVLAATSLLSLPFASLSQNVRQYWPQLAVILAEAFATLPAAVKHRQALLEAYESGYDDDDDDDDEDEDDEDEDEDDDAIDEDTPQSAAASRSSRRSDRVLTAHGDEDDEDVVRAEDIKYMKMLARKAAAMRGDGSTSGKRKGNDDDAIDDDDEDEDEDDDEDVQVKDVKLQEEMGATSAIDRVDEYILFADAYAALQQQQPQSFQALVRNVAAANRATLTKALEEAQVRRASAAAAAAAAS